jgi:hypothetical protein
LCPVSLRIPSSSRSPDHDPHRTIYYLGYPLGRFVGLKHRQVEQRGTPTSEGLQSILCSRSIYWRLAHRGHCTSTSTRRVGSDRQGFNCQLRVVFKLKVVATAVTVTEGESNPPWSLSYCATASVRQCACMWVVASNHTARARVQDQAKHPAPTKMATS